MNLRKILTALLLIGAMFATTACTKVPAGNVGVKVYLLGGEKGVDSEIKGPGRYWVGWNEEMYLFPTFKQNKTWTADGGAFTFGTIDGMSVSTDIGISYFVRPDSVSKVFQEYRKGVDEITDVDIRNAVASAFISHASKRKVDVVYGSGKEQLLRDVEDEVRKKFGPIGIEIVSLYWVGDLYMPKEVTESINAKIRATQMAEQRQNEVAQAEAEAEKARATAQGEADAKLMLARAEAEAIQIKGAALRANPELVNMIVAENWNGELPDNLVISGGSASQAQLLNIPLSAARK